MIGALIDLCKVLPGHITRFRQPWMQDMAASYAAQPGLSSAVFLTGLNSSLRLRRLARGALYLNYRYLRSRVAHAAKPAPTRPGPPRTISLLCPSRGRVDQACSFVRSVRRTAMRPDRIEVLLYVDGDDPAREEYSRRIAAELARRPALARCEVLIGDPKSVGTSWNELAKASRGDLIGMANDDQLYADYGWDTALDRAADKYPDGICCLYLSAGQYDENAGDFPFVSRDWYEALGYFTPTVFRFWGPDSWILEIGERVGRIRAVPGFLADHLHFSEFRAPFDATYQRHRLSREKSELDRSDYDRMIELRIAAAERLQAAIDARAGGRGNAKGATTPTPLRQGAGVP